MDHQDDSREQLLERINALEMLNRELLKEKEQETRLEYAWTGNLGHWYWNIRTNEVTFNPLKVTVLGYDKSEIPEHVTYQYFTEKLHPDDYSKTMDSMLDHLHGTTEVYEAEYRIRTKEGDYRWYYDRGKITQYNGSGKPAFLAGIVFDITEKKETQIELEHKNRILSEMSMIDGLTKISNHRKLLVHLKANIADAQRTGTSLSIAMIDIDGFKLINDSKGHLTGDQVLAAAADIISKGIRDTDLAGRYGGDEFMVILPGTDRQTALGVIERIRKTVESSRFAGGMTVTISGGIRQYQAEDIADFIDEADQMLYQAKRNGKNQVRS